MKKRLLSMLLVLCMVLQYVPVGAAAYEPGELCEHHTCHDESCGYQEPMDEMPCNHACNEACDEFGCMHAHDDMCGYMEMNPGMPCMYECTECMFPPYSVMIDWNIGGYVETVMPEYREGDYVEVIGYPDYGYQLESVTVTDEWGEWVDCSPVSDNRCYFTMPGCNVTVTAVFAEYHTYDALLYYSTEDGHYLQCDLCDFYDEDTYEQHYDDDQDLRCDVCYFPMGEEHIFENNNYHFTADGHCRKCDYCDYYDEESLEPHVNEDDDHDCDVCSYFIPDDHCFGDGYYKDAEDGHYLLCDWCDYYDESTLEPHVDEDANDICDLCRAEMETVIGGTSEDGLIWKYNENTGKLTISGEGAMAAYKSTNTPWDDYMSDILEVQIDEGVTSVGEYAFYQGKNIETVALPSTITDIGKNAFYYCQSLRDIHFSDGLVSIGDSAFENCETLTEVILPDSVTTMGAKVFKDCSAVENLQLSANLTALDEYSFYGCGSLKEVSVPASVVSMGDRAFQGCENLSVVSLHEGLETIGNYAFYQCSALTQINLPQSLVSVGNAAFNSCESLTSVVIPDGISVINDNTFMDCINLKTVVLPEGLTEIQGSAFKGCTSLSEIEIPAGVTGFGTYVFADCSALTAVVIPAGVTDISANLFDGCSALNTVTILGSVEGIDTAAFRGCTALTNIVLPGTVESIAIRAFYETGLTTAHYLGDEAAWADVSVSSYNELLTDNLHFCNWQEKKAATCEKTGQEEGWFCDTCGAVVGGAIIPSSGHDWKITYVNNHDGTHTANYICKNDASHTRSDAPAKHTYNETGCIYCDETEIRGTCGEKLTWILDASGTLTISGEGAMYNYSLANPAPWNAYQSRIKSLVIAHGATTIGSYAFYGCAGLTSVLIPESVVSIGVYAFAYCSNLKNVDIPDSVTDLDDTIWIGTGVGSLVIGGKPVTSLENYQGLKEIRFRGDFPGISDNAFKNVVATAYYPGNNDTWTADKLQNYGGLITWKPYGHDELEIIRQPEDVQQEIGKKFAVTVEAKGEKMQYQWYYKDSGMKEFKVSSNKSSSYAYAMQSYMHNRQVYCVITDKFGNTVDSETATITRPPVELKILQQPQNVEVEIGQKYSVKPTVQGDGLKYQWYYKNAGGKAFSVSSNKSSAYAYTMQSYMHNRQVYCVITDQYGSSVTTDTATITRPPVELKILQQPQNVEVEIGQKFSVKPTAQGDGLKYQWYYKDSGMKEFKVSSNKSSAYAYTMQSYMHNRQVYCVVTDQYGSSVTTDTVTITRPPVELKLLQQPQDVEVEIGQKFSAAVKAEGDGLKYQWYYKDSGMKEFKVSSNKSSAYAYTMQSYMHNRQVYCVVTDQYGSSVTTDIATITRPPMELKILAQPTDAYAAKGEKFSIKPSVQGDGLTYQWYYKDGSMKEFKVSSNKSSAYAYSMQSYMNNRSVYCVITDQYGAQVQTDAVTIHIQ